ncbi:MULTISPECIES: hypothetical protein [Nostocales]|uniref:Uncharacterized protein n=3 Tax=Nostocales TaxID=1161 RepID=A0A0C1R418_9CYAN|nr:hypothetical protein [Tolypothrix bouteillei]KAF3889545.1 hypothetical protein DA73_0400031770 [Tolypothrix bouteillei VB521301]
MIVSVQNHVQTHKNVTKLYNHSEASVAPEPIEFSGTNDISEIYQTTGFFFLVFLLINYFIAKYLYRKQCEQ